MKIRIDGPHYREAINLVNAISHLNPISVEIEGDEDYNRAHVIICVRFKIDNVVKEYYANATPTLFVLYHQNIADDICVVYMRMAEDKNKTMYHGEYLR